MRVRITKKAKVTCRKRSQTTAHTMKTYRRVSLKLLHPLVTIDSQYDWVRKAFSVRLLLRVDQPRDVMVVWAFETTSQSI